jgi:hypothetical protein
VRSVWAELYMPAGGNPVIAHERGENEDEEARVS